MAGHGSVLQGKHSVMKHCQLHAAIGRGHLDERRTAGILIEVSRNQGSGPGPACRQFQVCRTDNRVQTVPLVPCACDAVDASWQRRSGSMPSAAVLPSCPPRAFLGNVLDYPPSIPHADFRWAGGFWPMDSNV